MPPPRVSIVIATHDQGRWLARAIESVRAQTFADWELADRGRRIDRRHGRGRRAVPRRRAHPLPSGARDGAVARPQSRHRGDPRRAGRLPRRRRPLAAGEARAAGRRVWTRIRAPVSATRRPASSTPRSGRLPDRKPPAPLPARALPRLDPRQRVGARVGGRPPHRPRPGRCIRAAAGLRLRGLGPLAPPGAGGGRRRRRRRADALPAPRRQHRSAAAAGERARRHRPFLCRRRRGARGRDRREGGARAPLLVRRRGRRATTSRAAAFRLAARALRESPTQLPTGAALGALAAIVGARRGAAEGFTRA